MNTIKTTGGHGGPPLQYVPRIFNHEQIATSLPNVAIALDRSSSTALYRQLYEIRDAILSGRLAPGTRLPSTRELAGELNIARNTVLNTFEQLSLKAISRDASPR